MTTHGELWVLAMNNIRPLRLFKVPCCHGGLREQDRKLRRNYHNTLTCQETACWGTLYGTTCHVEDKIYIYIYIY
jgi:hypothetical protein